MSDAASSSVSGGPGLGVVAWILPILGAWLLAYRITPEHA
jgi:hypothetical protein